MGMLSDKEILWIVGDLDALNEDEPIVFSRTVLNVAAAVTGVIMVAGIIGNALTILAFCKTQRANNVTTVFIVCLCAADLLFCMTVLPFNLVRFTGGAGSLREEGLACKLLPFLQYGNVGVSLLFIAMITINRYIMIAHYAVYKKIYRTPFIVAMILFCWIFSFGMQIPTLLGKWGTYAYDSRLQSCTIMPDSNGRSAKSALFFVGFVIPCLVIIFCYTRIYMVVRRSDTRMRRHAATNTKLSRKGKEQKEVKLKRNEWRITKMVLTIFLSFLVCYLPITIIKIADSKIQYPIYQTISGTINLLIEKMHRDFLAWLSNVYVAGSWQSQAICKYIPAKNGYHILTYLLLYMSACINPIIYVIMNKQYRQAYKALLTCHKMPQMLSLQGRNTSLAESKENLISEWSIGQTALNQFWQSITLMGPKHQKNHSSTLGVGKGFDDCTAKHTQAEGYLVPAGQKCEVINEFWMPKVNFRIAQQHAATSPQGANAPLGMRILAGFEVHNEELKSMKYKLLTNAPMAERERQILKYILAHNSVITREEFEEVSRSLQEDMLLMHRASLHNASNHIQEFEHTTVKNGRRCESPYGNSIESEFISRCGFGCEWKDLSSVNKFPAKGLKRGITSRLKDTVKEPSDWQRFGDNHSSLETMHDDDECDFNVPLERVCGCLGDYHTIHLDLDDVYNQGDAENRPQESSNWLGFGNYCGDVEEAHEDDESKPREWQSFGDYHLSHELDPELELIEEEPSDWQGFGASCSSLEILHDDDECDSNGPLDWERLDHYYRIQEDRNSVDSYKQEVAKHNNTDILVNRMKNKLVQRHRISEEVLFRGSSHPSLVSSSGSSDDMKGGGSLLEREKKEAKSDAAIAVAGVSELMNNPAVAQEFPSEDLKAMIHALMFKFQALPRTKPIHADAFLRFCAESMSPSVCQEMEEETRNQGESSLWFKLKFGRITASNLYAVANCRTPSGYLTKSIVGLNSWFSGNEATMRGHRLEEQVIELVEKKMKMPFKKCGLFLSGAYPILGASPDGINDTHVLEIKSPFSEKSYKEYLDKDNKVKKRYLAQIQLQMYMTGRTKGLFCVSAPDFETSRRVEIISVEFDKDFTEDLVDRATKFWKANVFPLLTAIKGGSQGGDAEALNIRPLSC